MSWIENFWQPEIIDPEDVTGSRRFEAIVLKILKLYGFIVMGLCVVFTVCTLYLRILPLECWTPTEYPGAFSAMLIVQSIWTIFAIATVYGLLCLVVGISVRLSIQFRLLSHRLRTFSTRMARSNGRELEEIKVIVKYHIFLLK